MTLPEEILEHTNSDDVKHLFDLLVMHIGFNDCGIRTLEPGVCSEQAPHVDDYCLHCKIKAFGQLYQKIIEGLESEVKAAEEGSKCIAPDLDKHPP